MGLLAILYVLAEPIRIGIHQVPNLFKYPPIWLSIPIASFYVAANETWFHFGTWDYDLGSCDTSEVSKTWHLAVSIALAPLLRSFIRHLQLHFNSPTSRTQRVPLDPHSENWITGIEGPIESESEDLFSSADLAERIVDRVHSNERSLALVGQMGSGKSSILNLVTTKVKMGGNQTLIARVDLWRIQEPHDAPQVLLNEIVLALDNVSDTIGLRGISTTYRRLAAADQSGRIQRFFSTVSHTDSIQLLARIDLILRALNMNLLLIVEDAERLGKDFETRYISRFVWAIREIESCFTIISVDLTCTNLDVAKLCDTIVSVPAIPLHHIVDLLIDRHEQWSTTYDDLDPLHDQDSIDKFEFKKIRDDGLSMYLDSNLHYNQIRALATLLKTPRALRHTLRRVHYAWRRLHGEVDLDDLIIMTVLRECAGQVYGFIAQNIERSFNRFGEPEVVPSDDSENERGKEAETAVNQLRAEWHKLLESQVERESIERLVDLLGIEQFNHSSSPITESQMAPQGVCVEGSHYFTRILSERIGPHEVRDQEVLRDIEKSISGNHESLAHRLIGIGELGGQYRDIWLRLSPSHISHTHDISEAVFFALVKSYGADIDHHHPVFFALTKRLINIRVADHRRIEYAEMRDWILAQIEAVIPFSLSLVFGILHHWIDVGAHLEDDEVRSVRDQVLAMICDKLPNGDRLVAALSVSYPGTLRGITEKMLDFPQRFRSFVLEAAESHPDVMIPQLAYLLMMDGPRRIVWPRPDQPVMSVTVTINRERLHSLFADKGAQVIALLTRYDGSDPRCMQVASSARDLQSEA